MEGESKEEEGKQWENKRGQVPMESNQSKEFRTLLRRNFISLDVKEVNGKRAIDIFTSPANKKFVIGRNELYINMSTGAPEYVSEDGTYMLHTVSDQCAQKGKPANLMWVLRRAETMDVLLRSRRFAPKKVEESVCPHCPFSCICLNGTLDWRRADCCKYYSITASHVQMSDGSVLRNDAHATDAHIKMAFRVRAALFTDLRYLVAERCPDADELPFLKATEADAEKHIVRYIKNKNLMELYCAIVARNGPTEAEEKVRQAASAACVAQKESSTMETLCAMHQECSGSAPPAWWKAAADAASARLAASETAAAASSSAATKKMDSEGAETIITIGRSRSAPMSFALSSDAPPFVAIVSDTAAAAVVDVLLNTAAEVIKDAGDADGTEKSAALCDYYSDDDDDDDDDYNDDNDDDNDDYARMHALTKTTTHNNNITS